MTGARPPDIDVSVVVPVYNERDAVRKSLEELRAAMDGLGYAYEIVVVDDGSTDGSMEEIADLGVRIIRHGTNLGGGVARLTGMRYATGRMVLQTDADGTYPCDRIPEILERLQVAHLVIGARRRESATDLYVLRVATKWVLRWIAGVLVGKVIPDLNSGMRAYWRDVAIRYAYLYPRGHSIMSTMTLAFLLDGYRVEYVDIDYRARIGRTSFHVLRDTARYFFTIIRTVAFFRPMTLLMPVSLAFGALAIPFTVRDIYRLGFGPATPLLWTFALLIAILAVLGDQIARLGRHLSVLSEEMSRAEWRGHPVNEPSEGLAGDGAASDGPRGRIAGGAGWPQRSG